VPPSGVKRLPQRQDPKNTDFKSQNHRTPALHLSPPADASRPPACTTGLAASAHRV